MDLGRKKLVEKKDLVDLIISADGYMFNLGACEDWIVEIVSNKFNLDKEMLLSMACAYNECKYDGLGDTDEIINKLTNYENILSDRDYFDFIREEIFMEVGRYPSIYYYGEKNPYYSVELNDNYFTRGGQLNTTELNRKIKAQMKEDSKD